jgi:hypothetical protein
MVAAVPYADVSVDAVFNWRTNSVITSTTRSGAS